MKNRVISIAAISRIRRALGNKNELLWKIPGDLPRFKALTTGHPIIMGYKTYLSLPGLLPNRTNIIMSLEDVVIEGAIVVNTPEKALEAANKSTGSEKIYIIGGGMIYAALLPYTTELDLTLVDDEPEADVFFPEYTEFTPTHSEAPEVFDGITYTRTTFTRT
ncbi:diacylglycerol kinase [Candidatus Kaiserbacteria bacterium]|nr:MAG: diacylglycerol kinase [Candidatus Kaiserbacteria bacterium]